MDSEPSRCTSRASLPAQALAGSGPSGNRPRVNLECFPMEPTCPVVLTVLLRPGMRVIKVLFQADRVCPGCNSAVFRDCQQCCVCTGSFYPVRQLSEPDRLFPLGCTEPISFQSLEESKQRFVILSFCCFRTVDKSKRYLQYKLYKHLLLNFYDSGLTTNIFPFNS